MAANKEKKLSRESEKKVTVVIPRRDRGDTERYVSVNGRNALIRTGVPVEVPAIFAEVIEESIRADAAADRYTARMSERV